jgi:hypothetical protein
VTGPARTRTATARAGLCLALAAVLLGAGLAGCGKKGGPRPPEGEESQYTHPGVYPDPASVLRSAEPAEPAASREAPPGGDLSTFPDSRKRRTYGAPVQ